MESTREIALRTYNEQAKLGLPHNAMNWHLWKKAFDIAEIEFNKREAGKNNIESSEPHLPLGDVSGNEVEVCCKTCYFYDGNCSNPNICINHSEWKQTYR